MIGMVYHVLEPIDGAPDKPVRYSLEIDESSYLGRKLTPILTQSQDGFPDSFADQMFVNLESLVTLGQVAAAIIVGDLKKARELATESESYE